MTRQVLNRGTVANDGTGDTLRTAGLKINANFVELYKFLGGDSDTLSGGVSFVDDGIIFEGTSLDEFETKLTVVNPTADRVLSLPDATGDFVLTTATQTLTNKTLTSPTVSSLTLTDAGGNHSFSLIASDIAANRNVTLPVLGSNDEFTFNNHAQTLTNKTLIDPLIETFRIGTNLQDSAGNELITFSPDDNAINNISIGNASHLLHPEIRSVGSNTDINLELHSKGTGAVAIETKLALGTQNVTATPATVALTAPITFFNMGTAVTATMADGTVDGEVKHLININSGTATVTITNNAASRDTLTIASGQTVQLIYSLSTTEWYVVSSTATIS